MKKPMIILGTIQRVEKLVLDDSKEKDAKGNPVKVDLYQIVINDATRPAQFRGDDKFVTYLGTDKLKQAMGTIVPDELVDEKITFAAKEMKPSNAFLKLRGQMVKGHHAGEALVRLMADQGVQTEPLNAAPPAPKAAKA